MVSNGKRIAYGRNQNRVNATAYPDDTSVPVRTSHWNQDPHDQAILGFTKITATLDASDVIYTKDDTTTFVEDNGSTYSKQSTLIEVECNASLTSDIISKIDITDTNENDIVYLFKATDSDAITITSITPSANGHIKTQLSGGATLNHDGVPIMLIRRGNYWYEFGADGAAVANSFTPTSSDTLENKIINTSDNTLTVASADVTGLSTSLGLKSPLADPSFTGTVVLPNVPAIVTTQLDLKAPLASPTFTTAVTLPATDLDGNNIDNVQNIIYDTSALATATDIGFDEDQLQTSTFGASHTYTMSNMAAGLSKTIQITNSSAADRTATFPTNIKWVGTAPTSNAYTILANKTAIVTFTCFGSAITDVMGAFAAEE